jgi:hypothetical protein
VLLPLEGEGGGKGGAILGASSPLVVRARSSPAAGEPLFSDEDGRAILEADRVRRFLAEGRVAIVAAFTTTVDGG